MTLLITVVAAILSTVLWYQKDSGNQNKIGTLSLMYWGASLMWLVDAVFEYAELREAYFNQAPMEMLNDAFLGFSVVVLGMGIWLVLFLRKDPKGVLRRSM